MRSMEERRQMRTAYCVIFINKETLKVDSCEIFSEPGPTVAVNKYFPLEIFHQTGETYEEARDKVIAAIASSPAYTWLLNIKFSSIEKPDRSAVALVGEIIRKGEEETATNIVSPLGDDLRRTKAKRTMEKISRFNDKYGIDNR